MVINNEFNKLQINETIEKDADGNVIRRSLMLNIRCNDVEEAEGLYKQLKAKFNGNAGQKNGRNGNVPTCECGRVMVLRQGKRGQFYGCTGFPYCRNTKELKDAKEEAEETVNVEEIAF